MEEQEKYIKLSEFIEDYHFKDQETEERYLCGLLDGDGSIYISKLSNGYSLRLNFTQTNLVIENFCRKYFKFKIKDERNDRPDYICYQYIIHGKECKNILETMKKYSIVKFPQTLLALEFIDLIDEKGLYDKREELYLKLKELNTYGLEHKKILNENKRLDLLSDPYIAGLFDAEGTATYSETDNWFYIQIVQKNSIDLINQIKKYFTFGRISETYRYRIEDQLNYIEFYKKFYNYVIIKSEDLDNLHRFILNKCRKEQIIIKNDPKFLVKSKEDYIIEKEIDNIPEKYIKYINLIENDEKKFMEVYIKQYWKNEVINKFPNFYLKKSNTVDIDDICESTFPENKNISSTKQRLTKILSNIDNQGFFKKNFGGTGGANNTKLFLNFDEYSSMCSKIRNKNYLNYINKFKNYIKEDLS